MPDNEFEFNFEPDAADPKPGEKKTPRITSTGKRVGRPPKAAKQGEIEEQLKMLLTVASVPWQMRDPVCGGAMMKQSPAIAKALAAQAMQSPKLLKWLEAQTAPTGWVGIAIAVEPVVQAVVQHHVLPRFNERLGDFEPAAA